MLAKDQIDAYREVFALFVSIALPPSFPLVIRPPG